jgi:hypothetical protein
MIPVDIRAIARALGGEIAGRCILAPGPGHSAKDRSLSVRLDPTAPDGFLVHSFGGDDWRACREHVRACLRKGYGLGPGEQPTPRPRLARGEEDEARRTAFVHEQIAAIVRQLVPLRGTAGEQFLHKKRGIDTDLIADVLERTDAIGWHPQVYYNEPGHPLHGRRLGCVVGVMTDPNTGKPTGAISRTFLDDNGHKVCKAKSWGSPLGVVRLSRDEDVLQGLHIAEGFETAVAAMAFGFRPIWSAGSDTIMSRLPTLAGIETLTIFADNDENRAGECAAHVVEARWRAARREVRIIIRDKPGDFNDALRDAPREVR